MSIRQSTPGIAWKLGALLLGATFLTACNATNNKFIQDGLNAPNNKDADKVTEPDPIRRGPGLLTGKSGSYELYSKGSEEDVGDPNKPRRVERRRR